MKKIFVLFLFFVFCGTLAAWDKFNQYSIAEELSKPGVKLVAVDFYATWCEPCNAAIPKWKKLQEKYGDKGFKLIVVSVQSEGSCSQPPQWNPDKIVCDYDGEIADAWHANNLPQAFLWSWQGNLLVAHGGVDNVAAAIEQYFKKTPRVYVEEEGVDEEIYLLVRSKLRENSKIEIVANDEERKALAELRKKSTDMNYDSELQCKLGEEVSANSRLVISTQKRGQKDILVLELFSVEKGCLTASGTATMHGNTETEVAEAVFNLLKNLLGDVTMPGEGKKTTKSQKQADENSKSQDLKACEYARKESSLEIWGDYVESFPNGECSFEAKQQIKKLKVNSKNNIAATDSVSNSVPDSVPNLKLQWSDPAPRTMKWVEAVSYCENLTENGYDDWRLPNIDELRTLIQNSEATMPDGSCKISEKTGMLSSNYWTKDCKGVSSGNVSKLGDKGWFWSYSIRADNLKYAWNVGFHNGRVRYYYKTFSSNLRCVR